MGVTSYGRSFSMAEAGCYGPQCQFTGSRSNSNAMKGRCTGTAGYLAEAEIYEIINASSAGLTTRDTPSSLADGVYYDEDSDSYFLVYNHTEWVSYMGPEIRDSRVKKYKGLNMGGSVNWATDLEKFLDAPNGNWSNFIDAVKRGENPLTNISASSGNWSSISCNDAHFKHYPFYTPAERWSGLNVQDAWSDLMNDWKRFRENGTDLPFAGYIAYLTGVTSSTDCGRIPAAGGCEATARCEDSSPAQSLIWNSLSAVSNMYSKYHLGLVSAAALLIDPSLDDFTKTFAPVPPEEDDMWINVLVELISQATPMVGGKFFKSGRSFSLPIMG